MITHSDLPASALCRQTIERGGAVVLMPGILAAPASAYSVDDAPWICRLLGASEPVCRPLVGTGLESLVMACVYAGQSKTAAASLGYAMEFSAGAENLYFADPAYQQIDMNNATLTAPDSLALKADEADALVATLNQHFAADGLRFEQKQSQRWYCLFEQPLDIHTTPLSAAIGRDVAECKPTGEHARRWRSKLAEIEMLFFEHPVNHDRQMRGLLPVNTLWLHGEGHCESNAAPTVHFISDNFYTESLARHLSFSFCSIDQLSQDQRYELPAVLATEAFGHSETLASVATYKENLNKMDLLLGENLWRNYRSGGLSQILFWCGDDQFFLVQSSASIKQKLSNWFSSLRKSKPLSAYVKQSANGEVTG